MDDRQANLIDSALRQVEVAANTVSGPSYPRRETSFSDLGTRNAAEAIRQLPNYRIEAEIHRGGQGVVYQATQESTGKAVAIKVVLGGRYAGLQQLARFEREIRILAQLRHPGIVTIHDSGVAEGVAYYVMDYIAGRRLDRFLREELTAVSDRLRLFTQVCDAVHTAHLHGVIHRDLKPGNILVDDDGRPHVLDFGLAKPIDDTEDSSGDMTLSGQFLGSLPWASPEQAKGQPGGIDLRTDVYSLGVILYESLTGVFPYSVTGSHHEVLERIVNVEPKDPRSLVTGIDSDLATITIKALEKDRARRYQGAGALADDVRRYLLGEPIEARRSSLLYLLAKRISRHKWISVLAAATILSVVAGLIASISLWRLATRREQLAQRNAHRAEAVQGFLADTLAAANISIGGRGDISVRQAIDESVRQLDQRPLTGEPTVEGNIRLTIGRTYASLGLYDLAERQLRLAHKLASEAASETQSSLEAQVELVEVLRLAGRPDDAERLLAECQPAVRRKLGQNSILAAELENIRAAMARDRGNFADAESSSREALRIADAVQAAPTERATFLNDLGLALEAMNKIEEATAAQEEALRLFEQALGPGHFRTAIALSNVAGLRNKSERRDEAEELYQRALNVFQAAGGQDNLQVAACLDALGQLNVRRKDFSGGIERLEEALRIRRGILAPDHVLIANSLNNLSLWYYETGAYDKARAGFDQALAIYTSAHGETHASVASALNNIAAVERTLGLLSEAESHLRQALEIKQLHFSAEHPAVCGIRQNLGQVLKDLGRLDEAEVLFRDILRVRTETLGGEHPDTAASQDALAAVLLRKGNPQEAEPLSRQSLTARRTRLGNETLEVADSLGGLADILVARGLPEEALPLAEEALRIASQRLGPSDWRRSSFLAHRAEALTGLERFEEAEKDLRLAHDTLLERFGPNDYRLHRLRAQFANLFKRWGQPERAAEWGPEESGKTDPPGTPTR